MNEKQLLDKKCILVDMNTAEISTKEKPIIGTWALATCIGVLLYSEEKRVAIVAHVAPDSMQAINKIFEIIIKNKLLKTSFKYKIVPGYYVEHYNTKELIEKHLTHFVPFNDDEIPDHGIQTNEQLTSRQFAFDSSTGKFVTDKIFNTENFIDESSNVKHM